MFISFFHPWRTKSNHNLAARQGSRLGGPPTSSEGRGSCVLLDKGPVVANFSLHGVLTLNLAKAEEAKPKKIEVKVS